MYIEEVSISDKKNYPENNFIQIFFYAKQHIKEQKFTKKQKRISNKSFLAKYYL